MTQFDSQTPAHPAVAAYQLTVNYDKTPVLWDVSFAVASGQLVGIVGPNGAGKSTLIKTAMGLLRPMSGKIEFFGQPLKRVRQRIGYVPQRESVDWDFPITVHELVLMGRYGRLGMLRWPRAADREAANYYLDLVGMVEYKDRQISQLSGGQQQRAFIARALIQEADVYFMDEPFAGIDHASEMVIMGLLRQLRDKGKTVFVVHHDLNTIESYFDAVIMLNIGLIASGKVDQVFTPENLNRTYGKSYALLDEALRLAKQRQSGIV
jgi:manganese/zinc/iron transport system ATP- binding protein